MASELQRAGYELIETHISRVYLRAGDVYKTKRALNLGFLDFSTLAARHAACVAEVELNKRLAPDVYLGVVALVVAPDAELAFISEHAASEREVIDWAVHMRRLSDEQRADSLLARGQLGARELEAIARMLARFHAQARCDAETARYGDPSAIAANVEENFRQVASTTDDFLSRGQSERLAAYQRTFLREHGDLLRARRDGGFVRDGHGDLRLEHLYREANGGQFIAIDCIEFNERFRYADVCADVAFLTMDLRYHGRPELADLLLAAYVTEAQDYGAYGVVDFYESYRALVRAKVTSFLASDAEVATATRTRAAAEARRYYLLSLSAAERPIAPACLIVTFGLIASGKSTLANALCEQLGAPVLCADRTRKQLLGVDPEAPRREAPFVGAYAPEVTERVYATMLARARDVLASGRSVLLDATFSARSQRERARELAAALGARLLFVECRSGRELTLSRVRARAAAPSVSDGREEILDAFAARFERATELEPGEHIVVDSARELAESVATVLSKLRLDAGAAP
jgi:aminoglycoside phosphotransferase family enzyme/predicted kinase